MTDTVPMTQAAEHYYDGYKRGLREGKRQEMERILALAKLDLILTQKLAGTSDPLVWLKRLEVVIRTSAEGRD